MGLKEVYVGLIKGLFEPNSGGEEKLRKKVKG